MAFITRAGVQLLLKSQSFQIRELWPKLNIGFWQVSSSQPNRTKNLKSGSDSTLLGIRASLFLQPLSTHGALVARTCWWFNGELIDVELWMNDECFRCECDLIDCLFNSSDTGNCYVSGEWRLTCRVTGSDKHRSQALQRTAGSRSQRTHKESHFLPPQLQQLDQKHGHQ